MGPRMKMFGVMKYLPRPKTSEDWSILFFKNKIHLPQTTTTAALKKITLNYSTFGPGNAGIRHFKAYTVPPLVHWNPNIEVVTNWKKNERNFLPSVTLHLGIYRNLLQDFQISLCSHNVKQREAKQRNSQFQIYTPKKS